MPRKRTMNVRTISGGVGLETTSTERTVDLEPFYQNLKDAERRMAEWQEPRGPHEEQRLAEACPVPGTHDKLEEAHYFLHGLLFAIHHPDEFRWNLNAFLQACRSVLYLSKSELKKRDGFADWWGSANDRLNKSPVVKRVIDSRNFVVHERMLNQSSHVYAGLFRGRKMKLAFGGEPPNDWYSEALLRYEAFVWTGVYLDAEHSEIGMQFGVKREWHVTELGDGDVVKLCGDAYAAVTRLAREAHKFAGAQMPPQAKEPKAMHDAESWNLMLETQWWGIGAE